MPLGVEYQAVLEVKGIAKVFQPVMPIGVEHTPEFFVKFQEEIVFQPVTPIGVEQWFGLCGSASALPCYHL